MQSLSSVGRCGTEDDGVSTAVMGLFDSGYRETKQAARDDILLDNSILQVHVEFWTSW